MEDFGTALKRALDANGILPSELAKEAGGDRERGCEVAEKYSFSA